jgi:hypothetical protein
MLRVRLNGGLIKILHKEGITSFTSGHILLGLSKEKMEMAGQLAGIGKLSRLITFYRKNCSWQTKCKCNAACNNKIYVIKVVSTEFSNFRIETNSGLL